MLCLDCFLNYLEDGSENYEFVHHLKIEIGEDFNFGTKKKFSVGTKNILDDLKCPYCELTKDEDENNKKIIVWRIGCYQCDILFTNSDGMNKLSKRRAPGIIEFFSPFQPESMFCNREFEECKEKEVDFFRKKFIKCTTSYSDFNCRLIEIFEN